MKVLVVRQPWAWLIIHGGKDIENRSWATAHRGPLLIQASAKRPTGAEMNDAIEYASHCGVAVESQNLKYGGIIGTVDIVTCVHSSDSPWFMGPVGWVLVRQRPLPFTPIRGQLGIFDAPAEAVRSLKLPATSLPLLDQ